VVRHGHHRGVLSRAVVVQPRGTLTGFSEDFRAPLRRRIVGAAGKIAFLEADVVEHPFNERDVLRLSTV
jgi:hypothetical protein